MKNELYVKLVQDLIKEGLAMIPMDTIKDPILWWTDPHFLPDMEDENQRVLTFIEQAVALIKPKLVVNTGDTFHTKDKVYTSVLNQYQNHLEEIVKTAPVIQLVGNHDWGKLYYSHALKQYQNMRGVTNVAECYRLDHMAFVGYARDKERFGRLIRQAQGARDLFGHFDINGFQLSSHYEEVHAYSDIEDFGVFENIFSGHYHMPQEKYIKNVNENVRERLVGLPGIKIPDQTRFIYCGSPRTMTWGEADQHKRIGIIDGVTGEFYDLPSGMTFHKKLFVAPSEAYPEIPADDLARGVKFKVVLTGTKAQVKEKQKEAPEHMDAQIAFDIETEKLGRVEISLASNMSDALKKYFYTKLSRDFKVEISDENVKIISQDLKLDIQRVIERAEQYAKEAQSKIA